MSAITKPEWRRRPTGRAPLHGWPHPPTFSVSLRARPTLVVGTRLMAWPSTPGPPACAVAPKVLGPPPALRRPGPAAAAC